MVRGKSIDCIVIDAAKKTVFRQKFRHVDEAILGAGLKPGQIDHGKLVPGVGIVVYEFGLFAPKETTNYFSIGPKLFGGNAVLYGVREDGEDMSVPVMVGEQEDRAGIVPLTFLPNKEKTVVRFYKDWQAVERAIFAEHVQRPTIKWNGWQWPAPDPYGVTAKKGVT